MYCKIQISSIAQASGSQPFLVRGTLNIRNKFGGTLASRNLRNRA